MANVSTWMRLGTNTFLEKNFCQLTSEVSGECKARQHLCKITLQLQMSSLSFKNHQKRQTPIFILCWKVLNIMHSCTQITYTCTHAHTWMCGLITMHTKQQIVAKSKFATQAKLDYSRSIQGDYNILSYLYFMFTHLLPLLIATLAQFAETKQNEWRVWEQKRVQQ